MLLVRGFADAGTDWESAMDELVNVAAETQRWRPILRSPYQVISQFTKTKRGGLLGAGAGISGGGQLDSTLTPIGG
jgi:hypothetical protein